MSSSPVLPRIVMKLSGEVLAGPGKGGLDPAVLGHVAGELHRAGQKGARVAIVLGGGNIFRGLGQAARGMDRVTADQMGMLATVINGLALRDAIERVGGRALTLCAFPVGPICELYTPYKARREIDAGNFVIICGGTGNPFFSTDSAAALRAAELGCSLLVKGTKVDGVYDKDPEKHADAVRFDELTMDEMLQRRLGVIDLTAATLCRENGIDLRVYRMADENVIFQAALGQPLGTLVTAREK